MQHTTLHSIRMLQPYAAMTKMRCCVIIWTTALTKAANLLRTALPVMSLTEAQFSSLWSPVAINKLAHYKSLKRKCTDEEFAQAYQEALKVVTPLALMSREDQLYGIASALRAVVDDGSMAYSMEANHYNDPYGYFVLRTASCAGCARATALCLDILGIPYEHVNENQYSHQWCRVPMEDGSYWICDAFGLYCGPEPEPYQHPYF